MNKYLKYLAASLIVTTFASQTMAESRSWKFNENNNRVIEAQLKGG